MQTSQVARIAQVFDPDYDWMKGLPNKRDLINPLLDVREDEREADELTEFYKLCNPFYSPAFGIKYLMGVKLFPFQMSMIQAMLRHKFPLLLLTRGGGKTYILATYALYHAIMFPYTRIILVSASFRQSRLIFQEMEKMVKRWPLLQQLLDREPVHNQDHWKMEICGSTITALPMGDGAKIRGERGHVIIADEFNSIPIEIFDVVVRGFAATQLDPWEKVKARVTGSEPQDSKLQEVNSGNKIVLAGTAGYVGETLHNVYSHYTKIIANRVRGSTDEHKDIFDPDEVKQGYEVDCSNYCIVRYPWQMIPRGMMEKEVIEAARVQMPEQLFNMEYNTKFGDDSMGFFKAKQIREATAVPPNGFSVLKVGKPNRQYVMGIDPAKQIDRFAVTIVERGNPHKLVYCWTAQKTKYSECAAHVRELCRRFNVVGICMDAGGGGLAVEEMLNMEKTEDGTRIRKPEEAKFVRFDSDKEEDKDGIPILHLQNFSSNWLDESNTLLQKNIEDRSTMFPSPISESALDDEAEDILYEVAELKKELASITIVYTKTGKKSFDLKPPDERKEEGVKHKDRYSSFLLCNYMAMRLEDINYDEQEAIRRKYHDDDTTGGWAEDF